ncbi:cytochrome P450 [Hymenobacter sp. CRA2]|uniref:cytochrome P450 n=1 Tax=Hymenobacter sp. CRA2 TaxID=1955620 RepID=UPI00098FC6FC|nr:cytochrome P450 [Hymenobacter sp. CRA2]OON68464.1 cytochrome [Hymenobacter sp. CRA2]
MNATIPRDPSLDSTVALLREGFPFINNRCRRLGTDVFQMRLLGMTTICLHGPEAVRLFYDQGHFVRTGAIPKPVQKTLLGENGVQTMDDAPHRHRKAMFMSVMTPQNIRRLMTLMQEHWEAYAAGWEQQEEIRLFEQAQEVLCRAACAWAGVPLSEADAPRRARDFATMVDAFGTMAPRHWRGRAARSRAEHWIRGVIRQIRKGELAPAVDSPAYVVAWHRNLDDELLSVQMAAVELINLIRPIVAIAWYVTFAALALHQHPECRAQLLADRSYLELFVHEVRRFYPFAPFTGARVRADFDWQGYHFPQGTLVLLDVYGTNRDAQRWQRPDEFEPERFRHWQENPFDFIPQGGGDFLGGHRCAGEWITIEATKVAVQFLVNLAYEVPEQDLSFSLARMPTYPRSKFIMRNVWRLGPYKPL